MCRVLGQGLMREMLKSVEGNPDQRVIVLHTYGEELKGRSMYVDAGLAFLAAGDTTAALEAYLLAGEWHMVFGLAGAKNGPSVSNVEHLKLVHNGFFGVLLVVSWQ